MSTDGTRSAPAVADSDALARARSQVEDAIGIRVRALLLCAACAIAFAVAWPVFVFEGDQSAYLVSVAAAAVLAFALSADPPYAGVLVIGLATLVGTEARGELGAGDAPLGSLRILDVVLLAAVVGVAVRVLRNGAIQMLFANRRPGATGLLSAALVGWSVALWVADGATRSQFLNTDARLLALAVGGYLLVRSIPPARLSVLLHALVLLSPLLLVKALVVVGLDLHAIGTNDRIQATLFDLHGDRRVVLVGGDTLLILVPALFAVLQRGAGRLMRGALGASAVAGLLVLLMSGTRTSVLVALGLWACTVIALSGRRLWPPSTRAVGALAVGLVALAVALSAFGIIERFARGDNPHTGINFRLDEIRSASSLPARELVIGQGLAGTFVSKTVTGRETRTAWAHVLPVWLVLKVGVAGALAALVLLGLFVRHALGTERRRDPSVQAGLVVMLGLIAMSFTLGRIALPEGALLMGLACALVITSSARRAR